MAKILTEMPKKVGGRGRTAVYPYDEWLDGQIRELIHGEDFDSKPVSLAALIRMTAEKRGLKLRSRIQGENVVIQAYTPEPETQETTNGHKDTDADKPKRTRKRAAAAA